MSKPGFEPQISDFTHRRGVLTNCRPASGTSRTSVSTYLAHSGSATPRRESDNFVTIFTVVKTRGGSRGSAIVPWHYSDANNDVNYILCITILYTNSIYHIIYAYAMYCCKKYVSNNAPILLLKTDLDVSFHLKDSYLYELCQARGGTVGFVKEGTGGLNLFLITVKAN